jgi:hypothetical protein
LRLCTPSHTRHRAAAAAPEGGEHGVGGIGENESNSNPAENAAAMKVLRALVGNSVTSMPPQSEWVRERDFEKDVISPLVPVASWNSGKDRRQRRRVGLL